MGDFCTNIIPDLPVEQKPGDHWENNELICGKCGKTKALPNPNGKMIKASCDCERESDMIAEQKCEAEKEQKRIDDLKQRSQIAGSYSRHTFEADDNRNSVVSDQCKKYVEHWNEMKENRYGIIFYGAVGGGKSFYACCIANALIKKGVRVLLISLSKLVRNTLRGNELNISDYDLIILDDVGVEKITPTASEIIQDLYMSDITLIITTNLSLTQLKDPKPLEEQRAYSRFIELCVIAIKVDVIKSRLETTQERKQAALDILNQPYTS